jgi:hypothetical protein
MNVENFGKSLPKISVLRYFQMFHSSYTRNFKPTIYTKRQSRQRSISTAFHAKSMNFFYEYMIIIFNNNGQNCNVMHNSRILCSEISKLL